MTATDILRARLDERWVEYEAPHAGFTIVRTDNAVCKFYETLEEPERGVFAVVMTDWLTPEQAIAATLGQGTCKVDVLNTGDCAGYECSEYIMHCNGCGHDFGHVLYNEDGDVWMSEPPNFCPNCGRRIVEPTTNDVDAEAEQ